MRFEWNENKREINIQKHGFDFEGIEDLFENQTWSFIDERFDYSETRFVTTGMLNGHVVVVTHTQGSNVIRIISVRKATRNEQIQYFKEIAD
jgi:uncharacterized DUF497 family protein